MSPRKIPLLDKAERQLSEEIAVPEDRSVSVDSIVPRNARRRTSREIATCRETDASPSKAQLIQENQCYKQMVESMEQETHAYAAMQRNAFETAAQRYTEAARDITQNEVTQAESMASAHYISNVQLMESVSKAELGTQKFQILEQAEQAMSQQRVQIVEESRLYLQQQQRMAEQSFYDQEAQAFQQQQSYLLENQQKQQELASMWNELNRASEQMQATSSQSDLLRSELDQAIRASETYVHRSEMAAQECKEAELSLYEEQQKHKMYESETQAEIADIQDKYSQLLSNAQLFDIDAEPEEREVVAEATREKADNNLVKDLIQDFESAISNSHTSVRKRMPVSEEANKDEDEVSVTSKSSLGSVWRKRDTKQASSSSQHPALPAKSESKSTRKGTPNRGTDSDSDEVQGGKEASSIRLNPFPTPSGYRVWKMRYRKVVASSSSDPDRALEWITKQEEAKSIAELARNEGFRTLSSKLAAALTSCFTGDFARKMQVQEEEYFQATGKLLTGRQLGWYMDRHFQLGDAEGILLEFQDLQAVRLKGDDLSRFQNEWNMTLSGIVNMPDDNILEALYRMQVSKSAQFQSHFMLYENEILHKRTQRDYDQLKQTVKLYLDSKQREHNRKEMDSPHRGTAVKDKGKGKGKDKSKTLSFDCRQWTREGKCSRGKDCPFKHDDGKQAF